MMDKNAAALIGQARRITLKIGSSLLMDEMQDELRRDWLCSIAEDISELRRNDKQVAVVSSGAVALGRRQLPLKRSSRLAFKQAAAAAGQPLLMEAWRAALLPLGIATAQLLLTLEDSESRRRWLNAKATMEVILSRGALPIINENDSVATEELRFGDNDRLSARVAQMVQSDLLILLSDVDGLYTADPARNPRARHVPSVDEISEDVESWSAGANGAGPGSGGMRTKIAAARIAQRFGCTTIIASGREQRPLHQLLSGGARCTVIRAGVSPARAYKQWIAGTLVPGGSIAIDRGACLALAAGKSLLPAGVTGIEGTFERGACLKVLDPDDREIARGISAYTAAETRLIQGHAARSIEELLGYAGPDEVIHRDDLVLL